MLENPNAPDWAVSILSLRKRLGLSQSSFGSMLHYSAMAVSRWETGKMEPSARCYIQLGNLAGDPDGWAFWTRAGLKRSDLEHMSPADPSTMHKRSWPDFEIVHAGSGIKLKKRKRSRKSSIESLIHSARGSCRHNRAGWRPVHRFRQRLRGRDDRGSRDVGVPTPRQTNCLRVKGTSMSPLINDGDVVAVDGSQTNPKKLNGKIVVQDGTGCRGLSLARLIVADGVQLLEIGRDREYMPVPVERDRKWRIVGRVLWWIRQGP